LCSLSLLVALLFAACAGLGTGETTDEDQPPTDADMGEGDQPLPTDGDEGEAEQPELEAESEEEPLTECLEHCLDVVSSLDFEAVLPGVSGERELRLESVGLQPLSIFGVTLDPAGSPAFSIGSYIPDAPPQDIAPGSRLIVKLRVAPLNGDDAEGTLKISSDDDLRPLVSVRLAMRYSGRPELAVTPEALDFGGVTIGKLSEPRIVAIAAQIDDPQATRPLEVTNLVVEGGVSPAFALIEEGESACAAPFYVAPGEERRCALVFAPPASGEFSGALRVEARSQGGSSQTAETALYGEGLELDFEVVPTAIDFGRVLIPAAAIGRTIAVANVGQGTLNVTQVRWKPGASDSFTYGDPEGLIGGALEPGESKVLEVFYNPGRVGSDHGGLEIHTNSLETPRVDVAIDGEGIAACPPGFSPGEADLAAYCFCTPETVVCTANNSPTYRLCNEDGQTLSDPEPCPGGGVCRDGACGETVCIPSETRCAGVLHQEMCQADGMGWLAPAACAVLDPCRPKLCLTDACEEVPLEPGDDCDDGNPCTIDDACNASLACRGATNPCDDGNACTDDSCGRTTGCVHAPDDFNFCDDGDPCTTGDSCRAGSCEAGETLFDCDDDNPCTDDFCDPDSDPPCTHVFNDDPCDDGNVCLTGDRCCEGGCCPGDLPIDCNDGNPCTIDTCNATGGCKHTFSLGPCDDGDPCTEGDTCGLIGSTPLCRAGQRLNCDDHNPCTTEACNAEGECEYVNLDYALCSDDNHCTTTDYCLDGRCVAGPPLACDDGEPCTSDSCDPDAGCQFLRRTGACDDGDPCTQNDYCSQGHCAAGAAPLTCDDDNSCTYDQCVAGEGCRYLSGPNGADCDDGNPCTSSDKCQDGQCMPGALTVDCNDGDPCTLDSCNPDGGCLHSPQAGLPCDDENPCTEGDACNASGGCSPGNRQTNCDDGDPCKNWSCNPAAGCVYTDRNGSCDDGDPCTQNDACSNGSCQAGPNHPDCNDQSGCTIDFCLPYLGCAHQAAEGACNDGNACTTGDVCADGVCRAGATPLDCDDRNPCTSDSCDPAQGCRHADLSGAPCEDGNLCTADDHCVGRNCVTGSQATNCDDGNDCTDDRCFSATGCVNVIDATNLCNDHNACTEGDRCEDGQCIGDGFTCNDLDPCTHDSCDPNELSCVYTPFEGPCDDRLFCTMGEICTNGVCNGPATRCNYLNDQCNVAVCNEENDTCLADTETKEGWACDDGDPCTINDTCHSGACQSVEKDCSVYATSCRSSHCDAGTGECLLDLRPNGALCWNDEGLCADGICALALLGHTGTNVSARSVAFMKDGVASGGSDGKIRLTFFNNFDTFIQAGVSGGVLAIDAHPTKAQIATNYIYGNEYELRVWNYTRTSVSGGYLTDMEESMTQLYAAAFSPGGQYIACAGNSPFSPTYVWQVNTTNYASGVTMPTIYDALAGNYPLGYARAVAYSGNSFLATSGDDAAIFIWKTDNSTQRFVRKMSGHTPAVRALAYSDDGARLASGGDDKDLRVWNPTTGALVKLISDAHGGVIRGIGFSPDGRTLASGSVEPSIKLWDSETGTLAQTIATSCVVNQMDVATSGPYAGMIAAACNDGTVRVWEIGNLPHGR